MGPVWERGHLPIACDGYVPLRRVDFSRLNFMKVGIFFMKVGLNFMKWCLTELFSRNLCLQVAKNGIICPRIKQKRETIPFELKTRYEIGCKFQFSIHGRGYRSRDYVAHTRHLWGQVPPPREYGVLMREWFQWKNGSFL